MPITIASNIASLQAQRRLSLNTSALNRTFEKLSSGLRINRASDDAAGLAISASLKNDQRVYSQAQKNLNDGLSLLNVAEGTISNLSSIVTRLQELAEQSANGTYGASQRSALDKEAQALSKEYTRIAQSAKFNGLSLLDGTLGSGLTLQGGYGVDGGILSGVGGAIGNGTFQSPSAIAGGDAVSSVVSADFNGDGYADLASVGQADSKYHIALGNGDGTFRAGTSYFIANNPFSAQAYDLNGDGVLDLVAASASNNQVGVLIGNGDGTFQVRSAYTTGANTYAVAPGDVNGDGIPDLVSANSGAGTLSVLIGNGNGTFLAASQFTAGNQANDVRLADFNGDTILDAVITNSSDNRVSILLGNGDGSFKARVSYLLGNGPTDVLSRDLNGDGALDLAVVNTGGTVSIALGNGNGTFQAASTYAVGTSPSSIELGDFNGDGITDFVTADSLGTLSLALGNGDGSFRARTTLLGGSSPLNIKAADLNNDGVLDLVTANQGANQLGLYLANTIEGTSPLLPFDLSTSAGARQALPVFKGKIQQLSAQNGKIGAFQSRIGSAVNNLQIASENFQVATSRIVDADIAVEAANLVKGKILQQAAAAVLASANSQPETALGLLSSSNRTQ